MAELGSCCVGSASPRDFFALSAAILDFMQFLQQKARRQLPAADYKHACMEIPSRKAVMIILIPKNILLTNNDYDRDDYTGCELILGAFNPHAAEKNREQ